MQEENQKDHAVCSGADGEVTQVIDTKNLKSQVILPQEKSPADSEIADQDNDEIGKKFSRTARILLFNNRTRDVNIEIGSADTQPSDSIRFLPEEQRSLPETGWLYELGAPFAQGGQCLLYTAADRELGRQVAVKAMRSDLPEETEARRREHFLHEAELTAQLDHPSIVPVYSLSRNETGALQLAMKYVRGENLQDYCLKVIRLYRENGVERYDEQKSLFYRLDIFLKVCDALEYAHSRNVVHCDLKPENIMIGRFHDVYVMDWGIARLIRDGKEWTPPAKIVGTPRYIAPEVLQGNRPGVPSDIFSLGVILFELVTLRSAFKARSTQEVLNKVRRGQMTRCRHRFGVPISSDLAAIIRKATAHDPDCRYESAEDLAADVRRFLRGDEVQAHPDNILARGFRWSARNPRKLAIGFFFFLVLSVIGGIFTVLHEINSTYSRSAQSEAAAAVFSRSAFTALRINAILQRHSQVLESVISEFLLLNKSGGGRPAVMPVLSKRQMSDPNSAPPALAYAPAYRRMIDFSHICYTTVPEKPVSRLTRRELGNLQLLGMLQPWLRHSIIRSLPHSSSVEQGEMELEKRIRLQGAPLHLIVFGFPDGLFAIYPGTNSLFSGFDPRNRIWYRMAAALPGKIIWTRPFIGSYENVGARFACASAILDSRGKFLGVAGVEVLVETLKKIMAESGNTGVQVAGKYLFDLEGNIITAFPGTEDTRKTLQEPRLLEQVRLHKNGSLPVKIGEKEYLWSFFHLPSTRWYYAEKIDLSLVTDKK